MLTQRGDGHAISQLESGIAIALPHPSGSQWEPEVVISDPGHLRGQWGTQDMDGTHLAREGGEY